MDEVRSIAKVLGAKVTVQMHLRPIVSRVLSNVLKLAPSEKAPGMIERKVTCNGCGRAEQLTKWEIEDDWETLLPQIHLPMLRPDGTLDLHVPQSEWVVRFKQLQKKAELEQQKHQDLGWAMDVDQAEQLEADIIRASGPCTLVQSHLDTALAGARRFDNWKKTEKYDVDSIHTALIDLQRDERDRGACKQLVFENLATERQTLGFADVFRAAGTVLLATDEEGNPCVLLALEKRNGSEKLSFIGGKRGPGEMPRETAAREALEQCATLFTQSDRDRLESDSQSALTECWEAKSKTMLFAYELPNSHVCLLAAALDEYPVPSAPDLLRLAFYPLCSLLDDSWARSNLHSFCKTQLEMIRPWLQQYLQLGAAAPPPQSALPLSPDQLAQRRGRVQKLDHLYTALVRCEGMHEMLQKIGTRTANEARGADGRVCFPIEYEQKGIGGRRYAKGELVPCKYGDHRPHSATLQGMYSDLRPVVCGKSGHDIDCENGDFRLIGSLQSKYQTKTPIPRVCHYIANRDEWLREIMRIHCVDKPTAKRLPNIVSNGGSYKTWLDQNNLPFDRAQWYKPVLWLQRELMDLRQELFVHPQFKGMVDTERDRLKRENEKTEFGIEASLMSRIVQTSEDEVIRIIDQTFFDHGWDTLALVFDGLIAEPSSGCKDQVALTDVLTEAEARCKAYGWDIKLAEKPLHGLHGGTPRSVTAAREAMQGFSMMRNAEA